MENGVTLTATDMPEERIIKLVQYTTKPNVVTEYAYNPERQLSGFYKKYKVEDSTRNELLFNRLVRNGEVVFGDLLFRTGVDGTTPLTDMPGKRYAVVSVWAESEKKYDCLDSAISAHSIDSRKSLSSVYCVADLKANEIVWVGKPEINFHVENNMLFVLDSGIVKFLPNNNVLFNLKEKLYIGGRTRGGWIYAFLGNCANECDCAYKINTISGECRLDK